MAQRQSILVCGATGKQGGALITALLANANTHSTTTGTISRPLFHIFALTRNATSSRAQILAKSANVTVLEGDLDDTPAIFRKIASQGPLYGVFSVQVPLKPKKEEAQGKALVDAAVQAGVRHFVYTSADRGGTERSDVDSTKIAHFISKFNIENHLKKKCAEGNTEMRWSIIRPVFFMDNFTNDFIGRATTGIWHLNGYDRRIQMVSSRDVGILAADIFEKPEQYMEKSVSLATDNLSPREANEIFKKVVGKDMPAVWWPVAWLLRTLLHEQLGTMFKWFITGGFGAEPKVFVNKFPQMQKFETWLRQTSDYRQK